MQSTIDPENPSDQNPLQLPLVRGRATPAPPLARKGREGFELHEQAGKYKLPVLDYLQRQVDGTLTDAYTTHMKYPTAISRTLDIRIVEVGRGSATVEIDADPDLHGNQQGTVHGGLICELADAAIGTAHSTLMAEGESFTSLELKINFFRPVWRSKLRAHAKPVQSGRTITCYTCEITRDDGKVAAMVVSTVMTLSGEKAAGR